MYCNAGLFDEAKPWLRKEKNPLMKGYYEGLLAEAEGNFEKAKMLW